MRHEAISIMYLYLFLSLYIYVYDTHIISYNMVGISYGAVDLFFGYLAMMWNNTKIKQQIAMFRKTHRSARPLAFSWTRT